MNFDVTLNSSQIQQDPSIFTEGQSKVIEHLPREMMWLIFYNLKTSDLVNKVSLVSKAWSKLTKEEALWKALYQRDCLLFKAEPAVQPKETWRQTYKAAWTKYMLDDTDFVRGKVQKDGLFLKNASDRLKDDFETVELAVKQNLLALQFASKTLQENRTLIFHCLNHIQKNKDLKESFLKPANSFRST
jgi:hypothetical protein